MQSVFTGKWDLRHQKLQEESDQTEDKLNAGLEIQQHKLQEVPLGVGGPQNVTSENQRGIRHQQKLEEPSHHSDGVQIIPGGQRNTKQQHKLQDMPSHSHSHSQEKQEGPFSK